MATDKPRVYPVFVCSCNQCPKYKPLLADLENYSAYEKLQDDNIPFGFCKALERIVTKPLEILSDCPLDCQDKSK